MCLSSDQKEIAIILPLTVFQQKLFLECQVNEPHVGKAEMFVRSTS